MFTGLLLTCGLQVEDFDPPAACGEVGEVCEGQRLTELDLEVREERAAGGEDGQQLGHIVPGPDTQSGQLAATPDNKFLLLKNMNIHLKNINFR